MKLEIVTLPNSNVFLVRNDAWASKVFIKCDSLVEAKFFKAGMESLMESLEKEKVHTMQCVPYYEHDCKKCIFLGRWKGRDLYFHSEPHMTLIARESSEPSDYTSGYDLGMAQKSYKYSAIGEAYRRAQAKGLVK